MRPPTILDEVYVCDIKGTLLATYYPGEKAWLALLKKPLGIDSSLVIHGVKGTSEARPARKALGSSPARARHGSRAPQE